MWPSLVDWPHLWDDNGVGFWWLEKVPVNNSEQRTGCPYAPPLPPPVLKQQDRCGAASALHIFEWVNDLSHVACLPE